ncbi:uncharacterized protein LOC127845566 [Dreissena polymorpha]|uniref:Centromere protein N n=1 Tax=Dreissena polymorpha TaxID=45954 RepID=A0A9D4DV91_DREPO|nr:uncharacterized protein LOC127845566 [Dreissena polymorpha]KAH3768702.1 hypothetical protein DPMN_169919 [Dreissena polymorpha]
MEVSAIKNILSKLKAGEIFDVIKKWKWLNKSDKDEIAFLCNSKKTKLALIADLGEFFTNKNGLTLEAVGELELLCLHLLPSKKRWSAFHLSEEFGSRPTTVPEKFKVKLSKQIRLYFSKNYSVSVLLHQGLLWGRMYFPPKAARSFDTRHSLYFIYYPHSPVIIFSGLKLAHLSFISQCLAVTLGYKQITDMSLSGRCFQSLGELAINKYMQGGYARYVSVCLRDGPLDGQVSRKRKAPSDLQDDRVTDLNQAEKRLRLATLDINFGENIQPTLEKVQFRVELPYRSKTVATELQQDGELFCSRVKFEGTNVLEGLRKLGELGYATVPLPKHLTIIQDRARNNFLLARPSAHTDATRMNASKPNKENKSRTKTN